VHDQRPVFEVADPQRTGLIAGPATADFFLGNAQFEPGSAFPAQMSIEGTPR